jgi:hypothetical protein
MELLQRAYDAFNARDIDAALALMHPEVDWPNGFEGGREHGHEAVRAYWTRQWAQVDSHVDPLSFTEAPDGRVIVDVHQTIRELDGTLRGEAQVTHVYTVRDGLVARMDIVTRA